METALPTVHTFLVNAVVEHVRSCETGLHHLRLLHEHDPIDAWSWLPTEPSAEKMIFSTFILASANLCSQCRFSRAPRS